tara:strand:- start:14637 stop:15836 length:1200 start_codon:yes stop_codon:yes gene_type:complete
MAKSIQDVYVVSALRTPVGKAKGAFANTRPDDLLSVVLQEIVKNTPEISPDEIEDVIIGCAMPEAEQGMNVARIATLLAGLPESVPAMTINRFCSSGLQAISLARDKIALGDADVVIAGGVESMSMVPMGGHAYSANMKYFDQSEEYLGMAYSMGVTAEKVAKKWGISRAEQDEFAFLSHQKAIKAQNEGVFANEIVPVTIEKAIPNLAYQDVQVVRDDIRVDQGPRENTSVEALARLRTVFAQKGTVTAGNTSQMSDGASALMLVSENYLAKHDLLPMARLVDFKVAGVAPEYMGIGPVPAIQKVLKSTGLKLSDIEWIELNEAFAAQSLSVVKELGIDLNIVNPLGGAIALGHPLGATGAILATKMIHGMRKKNQRYGIVTMCIGTGMGAAGLFEIL